MPGIARKATPEQILRSQVGGQSKQRINWATEKKKWEKTVDTSLFKENLGRALDSFRDICDGAQEIRELYGQLDQRTLKPLRDRKDHVLAIMGRYRQICTNQLHRPNLPAPQQRAWQALHNKLELIEDMVNGNAKKVERGTYEHTRR